MTSSTPRLQPLVRCAQWPVMLVLPGAVSDLARQTADLARTKTGEKIYAKHMIAALITCRAPETPDKLAGLFWSYVSSTRFGAPPQMMDQARVTIALPAPVSHRLDLLVANTRSGRTEALRRDVVGALVTLYAPTSTDDAYALYQEYVACAAVDAKVAGFPLKDVLSLTRPKPGRRPRE